MNCRVCETELPEGALFCGECGSAVTSPRVSRDEVADSREADTSIVRPATREDPGPAVAHGARERGADERSADERGADERSADERGADEQAAVAPSPEAVPAVARHVDERQEIPFALRFPSGRAEAVRGSGLLGRRPVAQPSEVFDQYVAVDDPERTVSKTHLQFGIEGYEFWVCDRYSANGTIVVSPRGDARPCEPGRRYRAPRGSRVEIGETYFDVE